MPDRGAIWRIQGTLGHTETYQLLGLFLLAQRCLAVFKSPFDARQRGNRKLISGNNLGTMTCSRGAYRAYRSDQGLVKTGVISKREVDTVEVRSSSLLVPTIILQQLPPECGNRSILRGNSLGTLCCSQRGLRLWVAVEQHIDCLAACTLQHANARIDDDGQPGHRPQRSLQPQAQVTPRSRPNRKLGTRVTARAFPTSFRCGGRPSA